MRTKALLATSDSGDINGTCDMLNIQTKNYFILSGPPSSVDEYANKVPLYFQVHTECHVLSSILTINITMLFQQHGIWTISKQD